MFCLYYRKRPVIEVVDARPMSQVGFRDARPEVSRKPRNATSMIGNSEVRYDDNANMCYYLTMIVSVLVSL